MIFKMGSISVFFCHIAMARMKLYVILPSTSQAAATEMVIVVQQPFYVYTIKKNTVVSVFHHLFVCMNQTLLRSCLTTQVKNTGFWIIFGSLWSELADTTGKLLGPQ